MTTVPTDVPVHRASVGAMSVTQGSQVSLTVNPYVYRGKGYDIREGEPEPKRRPTKKRKPKPRPKPKPKPPGYRKGDEGRAAIAKRVEQARLGREALLAERQAERLRLQARMRPSPGWQPMRGSDLDDLLEGL